MIKKIISTAFVAFPLLLQAAQASAKVPPQLYYEQIGSATTELSQFPAANYQKVVDAYCNTYEEIGINPQNDFANKQLRQFQSTFMDLVIKQTPGIDEGIVRSLMKSIYDLHHAFPCSSLSSSNTNYAGEFLPPVEVGITEQDLKLSSYPIYGQLTPYGAYLQSGTEVKLLAVSSYYPEGWKTLEGLSSRREVYLIEVEGVSGPIRGWIDSEDIRLLNYKPGGKRVTRNESNAQ
jgi:hypothetical protein